MPPFSERQSELCTSKEVNKAINFSLLILAQYQFKMTIYCLDYTQMPKSKIETGKSNESISSGSAVQ